MNFPITVQVFNSLISIFQFPADNYENHFKCNLQECDCHYEKCAFEQNILCLNEKMAKFKNEPIDSPHCGPLTLQKLENAKILGPKLSTLNQRFQRVSFNLI
jgi:hypothetical protein